MSSYQFRLEIRYGNSAQAVGCFWPGSPSGSISVGSRGAWRVEGAGVPEYAAYLYFDGTQLFVASVDANAPVVVSGHPQPHGYRALQHGDMIDFGQARLGVSVVEASAEHYVPAPTAIGEGPPPPPFAVSASEAPAIAPAAAALGGTMVMSVLKPEEPPETAKAPLGRGATGQTRVVELAEIRRDPQPVAPGAAFSESHEAAPSEPPPTRVFQALPSNQNAVPTGPSKLQSKKAPKAGNPWSEASLPQKCILVLMPFALIAVWFTLGPGKGTLRQSAKRASTAAVATSVSTGSAVPEPSAASKDEPDEPEPAASEVPGEAEPKRAGDTNLPPPEPTAPVPLDADGLTPARRAADALIGGDFAAALSKYEQLSADHPESEAYASAVRIIARRLKASEEN